MTSTTTPHFSLGVNPRDPHSNLCLIIDLAGKSRAPTSVAQAKLFVEILGNHYPERLGSVSPARPARGRVDFYPDV